MSTTEVVAARSFNLKRFLADQLRNIAPVFTLFALVVFFSIASPSFVSMDNAMNIFSQVSITGIIAVGLTFVILTAEIDLSVAAVGNAVGIVVAYFTLQPDYVNIPNIPLAGIIAVVLTLLSAFAFGAVTAFGIFSVAAHWNDYFWPLIAVSRKDLYTPPLGVAFFRLNDQGTDYGVLMAAATLVILPLVIAFLLAQRRFIEGVTFTGLKG